MKGLTFELDKRLVTLNTSQITKKYAFRILVPILGKKTTTPLHHSGIEPEANAWKAFMLPLHQWCLLTKRGYT